MLRSSRFFIYSIFLASCVYHDLSPDSPPVGPVCDPETISWQKDIQPIMINACATSGCHDGIVRRDWSKYSEVKQYAGLIKQRTQDRSMPFDGPLPQHQIDLIACWVDGGALQN